MAPPRCHNFLAAHKRLERNYLSPLLRWSPTKHPGVRSLEQPDSTSCSPFRMARGLVPHWAMRKKSKGAGLPLDVFVAVVGYVSGTWTVARLLKFLWKQPICNDVSTVPPGLPPSVWIIDILLRRGLHRREAAWFSRMYGRMAKPTVYTIGRARPGTPCSVDGVVELDAIAHQGNK